MKLFGRLLKSGKVLNSVHVLCRSDIGTLMSHIIWCSGFGRFLSLSATMNVFYSWGSSLVGVDCRWIQPTLRRDFRSWKSIALVIFRSAFVNCTLSDLRERFSDDSSLISERNQLISLKVRLTDASIVYIGEVIFSHVDSHENDELAIKFWRQLSQCGQISVTVRVFTQCYLTS
jgi:hypothetical protein